MDRLLICLPLTSTLKSGFVHCRHTTRATVLTGSAMRVPTGEAAFSAWRARLTLWFYLEFRLCINVLHENRGAILSIRLAIGRAFRRHYRSTATANARVHRA